MEGKNGTLMGKKDRRRRKIINPAGDDNVIRLTDVKKQFKKRPRKASNDVQNPFEQPLRGSASMVSRDTQFYPMDNDDVSSTTENLLGTYTYWPQSCHVAPTSLVQAGFRCINAELMICECTQCNLMINVTQLNNERPIDVHRQESPSCPFHRNTPWHLQMSNNQTTTEDNLLAAFQRDLHIDSLASNDLSRKPTGNLSVVEENTNGGHSRIDARSGRRPGILNEDSGRNTEVGNQRPTDFVNEETRSPPRESAQETSTPVITYNPRNPTMVREQARRDSYRYWPHQGQMDLDLLVDAGFFFTGTEDIVRCYYCDIGLAEWNADDDPWAEHARHSPECPFLREMKSQQYIKEIQREWARVYSPKRPEFVQLAARLKSFENCGWPRSRVRQTPRQIAEAGFYYIGEGDTVRCHYCDGGLREWEPNDDPWLEHARWFPFCKFVLKVKGIQFIQNSANPSAQTESTYTVPVAYSYTEGQSRSYEDECRRKERQNPLFTVAAQSLKSMGYGKETIKIAIDQFISQTGRRDFEARDLLNIIFKKEEEGELSSSPEASGGTESSSDEENQEMELSENALRKENEYLMEKIVCIICKKNDRCMVYVPCGHRLSCETCAMSSRECSHCNRPIDNRIKTFMC